MSVKSLTLAASLVGALAALPAAANESAALQSLDAVRAAAERGLRTALAPAPAGLELEAAPLDDRLRLPACAKFDTQVAPPRPTQSRVLVRVTCSAGAAWYLNVPVDIRRTHDVLVVRRTVARGEQISAADVGVQKRVLPGLASPFVARAEDLAGRVTRRPIPDGTAVSADALGPALLIHRGQSVTLTAASSGIEVRAPGKALADAAANQRVRVQNLDSLKVIEGVAESAGVVRVSP